MNALKVGALFAGYGGIELALASVLDTEPAWFSEFDKAPSAILAHHWPDVPNLGDVTKIDWAAVEPVDIITGGSPCQDLSHAGKRAGMKAGTRSGLWASMCDAIDIIRPRLVVWENVRGALSAEATSSVEPCPICVGDGGRVSLRALGRVLGDLAELGYDARWYGLRAADVGAAHGRFRVFLFAQPADADHSGLEGLADQARTAPTGRHGHPVEGAGGPAVGAIPGQMALLPTPNASDTSKHSGQPLEKRKGHALRIADVVEHGLPVTLLPTLAVNDMGKAYTPEEWDAWTDRMKAEHGNGNGHGKSLNIEALRLLKTPTSQLAVNGGSQHPDKRKEGGHGPTLADEVEHLLPTPRATRGRSGTETLYGLGAERCDTHRPQGEVLLPTPVATDAAGSARHTTTTGVAHPGTSLTDAIRQDWREYEAAIRRQEAAFGRPAPLPTEPGAKGQPRLSPRFVEWLMALPDGWVTDVPGISRNDMLKALGNGVCPPQCAAALRAFLSDTARERAS